MSFLYIVILLLVNTFVIILRYSSRLYYSCELYLPLLIMYKLLNDVSL